jgi:glycerol-3-phosphate acyltransferase PlsY
MIGSIPFGVLIARTRGVNIREHGSRNIGATNVGRVLGRRFGVLCFVLDFLKGAGPVIAAGAINHTLARSAAELQPLQMWLWLAVACAAVIGHMDSIYLGFGGGKGVATGFGAIAAMYSLLTWPALAAIVVWYLVLRISKYVSLSSMIAVLSLPVSYMVSVIPPHAMDQPWASTQDALMHAYPPFVGTLAIALLVVWKHRANIGRLRRGEEPRVSGKQRRGGVEPGSSAPSGTTD